MTDSGPVLVLAPMRGITTMHYRQAYAAHFDGLDIEMAPFIPTVSADRINPKLLRDILPENRSGLPLVPQLIGNNPADFVTMCRALYELGYEEANWNLGCPHKPIRRKIRGSGLLVHPERVAAVLDRACSETPLRLSVKVRLGVADKSELMNLIPVLNQFPLSEVIIHARTAEQMYDGVVDLDAFEEAYRALKLPVCYNGDLYARTDFERISTRFPDIRRFMLGRGLLANPFLCEEIKNLSRENYTTEDTEKNGEMDSANSEAASAAEGMINNVERIAAFHDDLLERYVKVLHGDHPVLGKMKEFWTYQSLHLSNGRAMFKKLKKTKTLYSYNAIVAEFLAGSRWQIKKTF